MNGENICKFNLHRSSDLICENFIFETSSVQEVPETAASHGIYLVTEGSGIFCCDEYRFPIETGTLFFRLEGSTCAVESIDNLKYCYIHFRGRRGDEYLQRIGISRERCVFVSMQGLIPFWLQCNTAAEEGNIDLLCESVLLYSLAVLKPAQKATDDVLARLIALTQDRFTDNNLSLNLLASEVGYNDKYLSSLFKRKMGISFSRYLQKIRIRHAVFLMEEGVVCVKNVAILSGFRDALYFSKVFTKSEGLSPSAYIQQINRKKQ